MNRKQFLQKTSFATIGFAFSSSIIGCISQRTNFEPLKLSAGNLERVRGNVFRFTNRGGTVGVLETKDGFMIVDSQFPDAIQPILDAISTKGKPIEFLCNTHHHGDHTSGNVAFKNLAKKVVAQKNVPALQKRQAEERKTLDQQLYASTLFETELKLEFGNEKITAYHLGNGHTFGDAVYHFEKDNVVHMGDLMFNNLVPVYRTRDGADSLSWIKVLNLALEKFDNDTKFIFGHSDDVSTTIGTKENLVQMREFLSASNDLVSKFQKEGKTAEDFLKTHSTIPGFENRKSTERFPDFIKGIWETLEKG